MASSAARISRESHRGDGGATSCDPSVSCSCCCAGRGLPAVKRSPLAPQLGQLTGSQFHTMVAWAGPGCLTSETAGARSPLSKLSIGSHTLLAAALVYWYTKLSTV